MDEKTAIEELKAADELKAVEKEIEALKAEKILRDAKEELNALKDAKPNVLLNWFRENRLFRWVKRVIGWKTLLTIAAVLGGGYYIWYKWFKDNGIDVECPEGMTKDEKTGECVKGGGGTIDPNDPDVINELDPSKFIECVDIYKFGCKSKDGSISKIQNCLGIKDTGLFGKPTEDALYKKINKRTFTKDDIDRICKWDAPNITRI
jgi:hypothetical protein